MFERLRGIFYLIVVIGTLLGLRSFNPLPVTKMRAESTPAKPAAASLSNPSYNLIVRLKCYADPSRNCLTVHSIGFRATEILTVKASEGLILDKPGVIGRNSARRTIFQLSLSRSLKGGEGIFIAALTNSKLKHGDLTLESFEGDDVLGSKFECRYDEKFDRKRMVCEEVIGWLERFASLAR